MKNTKGWKKREKLYKKWRRSECMEEKIKWKRARAIATRTFKLAKQENMKKYLSTMTVNTPPAKIYEKIRQIRGRPARRVNILRSQGNLISTIPAVVNCLADNFAAASDPSTDTPAFKRVRQIEEKHSIYFNSNNDESYNKAFTIEELTHALKTAKDTTPGPDNIHYKMLKYLPHRAKIEVCMFNTFWINSYFFNPWQNGTYTNSQAK